MLMSAETIRMSETRSIKLGINLLNFWSFRGEFFFALHFLFILCYFRMRMRRGLKRKRRRWDASVMTFGHFIPTFSTHTLSVSFNKWKLLTASRRWTMVAPNHQSWVVQRQMCSPMSNPGGGEERGNTDGGIDEVHLCDPQLQRSF